MERIVQVVDGVREGDFDAYTRLCLDAKLRVFTGALVRGDLYDDAFNMASCLLNLGKIGSSLYDLYIALLDNNITHTQIRTQLLDFVSTFKISEYLLASRKFILLIDESNIDLYARASLLNTLLIQSYGFGHLLGTTPEGKAVVSNEPTASDYYIWMFKALVESKHVARGSRLYMLPNQISLIQKKFKGLYETGLKNWITSKMKYGIHHEDGKDYMAINKLKELEYSSVFNFMDDQFSKEGTPFSVIESSKSRELSKEFARKINSLISTICTKVLGRTALKNRNLYVREKGVTLRFKEPVAGIDSITVREFHNVSNGANDHFLLFFYTQGDDCERCFSVPMDNLPLVILTMGNQLDSYALLIVLRWLGILDDLTLDSVAESLEKHLEADEDREYLELVVEIKEWLVEVFNGDNFYYETPQQWNYDIKSNGKSLSKQINLEGVKKIVTVGRYTRRLPAGQKPSAQAKKLAARYYMELKPGYTLVDEFERVARSSVFNT